MRNKYKQQCEEKIKEAYERGYEFGHHEQNLKIQHAKEEAYDEFFLAVDKEFESFKITEAMGKILIKLKESIINKK